MEILFLSDSISNMGLELTTLRSRVPRSTDWASQVRPKISIVTFSFPLMFYLFMWSPHPTWGSAHATEIKSCRLLPLSQAGAPKDLHF